MDGENPRKRKRLGRPPSKFAIENREKHAAKIRFRAAMLEISATFRHGESLWGRVPSEGEGERILAAYREHPPGSPEFEAVRIAFWRLLAWKRAGLVARVADQLAEGVNRYGFSGTEGHKLSFQAVEVVKALLALLLIEADERAAGGGRRQKAALDAVRLLSAALEEAGFVQSPREVMGEDIARVEVDPETGQVAAFRLEDGALMEPSP